jgi:hypothetical protein
MKNLTDTKPKKLNRMDLINFIKKIQGITESHQENFTGKNMYFIGNDKNEPDFQLEFIPQSPKYFFTIYLRGLKADADNMHEEIRTYLQKQNLNRNIVLSTESFNSFI